MTTIHHTPPPGATPFAIYEDEEDLHEPPSPSDIAEEEPSFTSELSLPDPEKPIASIEHEEELQDEPEPYVSSYTSRPSILSNVQSRRVSGVTTTSFVSSLPSEVSVASKLVPPANHDTESRYTPRKERPPFRNPSSVRAMQMSSPPPFATIDSSRDRLKGSYKLATPSRSGRSETPVSNSGRSVSQRGSRRRDSQAHAQQSAQLVQTPQQHLPLVLLHVTILPMVVPYPRELMVRVMPSWLLENYRVLAEKLEDIILMNRGLLIPHPRDEYDVLEETVLESLELQTPRLLKCGHFVPPAGEDEDDVDSDDDEASVTTDGAGRGSRMSGGTITVDEDGELKYALPDSDEASFCTDCHRQVKRPGQGVGIGKKRWDIKIYAANGLMRSGAWSAAWKDMERCDVEISPWIPEDVRKSVEYKIAEEQEAERRKQLYQAELQQRMQEEQAQLERLERQALEKRKQEEAELKARLEIEKEERLKELADDEAEKNRAEEAWQQKIEEAKESIRLEFEARALEESRAVAERLNSLEEMLKSTKMAITPQPPSSHDRSAFDGRSRNEPRISSRRPPMDDIPISTLLRNYFVLLAQDQKNVVILLLGTFVVFLAIHVGPGHSSLWTNMSIPNTGLEGRVSSAVLAPSSSEERVTTTATVTTTAISVSTVTQFHVQSVAASPSTSPSSEAKGTVKESNTSFEDEINISEKSMMQSIEETTLPPLPSAGEFSESPESFTLASSAGSTSIIEELPSRHAQTENEASTSAETPAPVTIDGKFSESELSQTPSPGVDETQPTLTALSSPSTESSSPSPTALITIPDPDSDEELALIDIDA